MAVVVSSAEQLLLSGDASCLGIGVDLFGITCEKKVVTILTGGDDYSIGPAVRLTFLQLKKYMTVVLWFAMRPRNDVPFFLGCCIFSQTRLLLPLQRANAVITVKTSKISVKIARAFHGS